MDAPAASRCAVALKEWAAVLEAMARGEQLLLIRKGGLIEPGSGFELRSTSFVLYPTFEHQTVNYLRSPYQRYMEEALRQRAPEGRVRIGLFGEAVHSMPSRDPAIVERLRAFHIYNDAFLSQRLKWQPDQPLMIVIIRAFRFGAPHLLAVAPHYAGCKSWVELESPVSLEGLQPVLEPSVFQQRLKAIEALLRSS